MRKVVFFVLLSFPIQAFSTPVYLDCKLDTDGVLKEFEVAIDESSSKITHTPSNTKAVIVDALFTSNFVRYDIKNDFKPLDLQLIKKYEVSRKDLSVKLDVVSITSAY